VKNKIFSLLFNTLLVLPAAFFVITGFSWLVSPESAAENLMMPLLKGAALGSQMGDIGGMFFAMGLLVMCAVVTGKGDLLKAVSILLACIVFYRLLAFALYSAAVVPQMLVFEIVLSAWFAFSSKRLLKKEKSDA
jgi:hypothetical protein